MGASIADGAGAVLERMLQQRTICAPVTYAERELFGQDVEAFQGLFIGRRQRFYDDFGGARMLDNFSSRQCCQW